MANETRRSDAQLLAPLNHSTQASEALKAARETPVGLPAALQVVGGGENIVDDDRRSIPENAVDMMLLVRFEGIEEWLFYDGGFFISLLTPIMVRNNKYKIEFVYSKLFLVSFF